MVKVLMKGNEAIGEAALKAGCRYFFGYPITPQSELPEYLARRLPEVGGVYLQAESEVAAINMVYGAAGSGARVMTSSSSPGISLKQEGISYIAGAQLPCLIVNVTRGGPGLGSIQPAQSDYNQSTKNGGHGDYRLIVLAPNSVQEAVDLTVKGFALADKYRNPVMLLADGVIGQMMEPVEFPESLTSLPEKPWATCGKGERERNIVNSLYIDPYELEQHNIRLKANLDKISENEIMSEAYLTEDAELILIAYGTSARIAQGVVDEAREAGLKLGLFRPITLWPYPSEELRKATLNARALLCVEMSSLGQMVDDVKLAVQCQKPVYFYGRSGGVIPTVEEVYAKCSELLKEGV
ncbi:MAG: 3-methyl-2-oxobutanoate dehydrogenase subunit VorB [Peptococcaceae bacterium]